MKLLGIRIEEASGDRVVLTCPVTRDLHQPFGLVHGGVYATLAETAASVAGASWFGDQGKVVGVSNHTDFLRAVRAGGLRAEATPLSRVAPPSSGRWRSATTRPAGRHSRSGSRTWPRPRRLTVGLAVDRHEHVHGRAGRVVDLEVGRERPGGGGVLEELGDPLPGGGQRRHRPRAANTR